MTAVVMGIAGAALLWAVTTVVMGIAGAALLWAVLDLMGGWD